jgi:hypothetical protein
MGKVLDVYFQLAASGDHYLGQLLSLKDPNSVDFDTPCPHWKDPSHPVVMQALELTFMGQSYWSIVILPMTLKVFCLYSWHLWCITHLGRLVLWKSILPIHFTRFHYSAARYFKN